MPKASKKTQVIVTNKKLKPTEMAKLPVDVKAKSIESTNLLPITKPKYQRIAPVHFEELYKIWENDRRIPTKASRTAWSLARNLNPININSWWYRRKVVAKKFKINIPGGSYELDVGTPPLIVVKLEELPTPTHVAESPNSDSAFPNSGSGDTLVNLSSLICADLVASKKIPSGYTDTPIKGAYIRDSKASEDVIVASDCALDISSPTFRDSSPLPPSSPNIWPSSSLPPASRMTSPEADADRPKDSTILGSDCILILDHSFSISTDDCKRIDLGIKMV